MAYFTDIATQLGMSIWLLVVIIIWSLAWKIAALWKAAQRRSLFWFIVLFLVNTIGIFEILYIFVFSEWKHTKLIRHSRTKIPGKVKKKNSKRKKR